MKTQRCTFRAHGLEKYRGSAKVAVSGNSRSLSGLLFIGRTIILYSKFWTKHVRHMVLPTVL